MPTRAEHAFFTLHLALQQHSGMDTRSQLLLFSTSAFLARSEARLSLVRRATLALPADATTASVCAVFLFTPFDNNTASRDITDVNSDNNNDSNSNFQNTINSHVLSLKLFNDDDNDDCMPPLLDSDSDAEDDGLRVAQSPPTQVNTTNTNAITNKVTTLPSSKGLDLGVVLALFPNLTRLEIPVSAVKSVLLNSLHHAAPNLTTVIIAGVSVYESNLPSLAPLAFLNCLNILHMKNTRFNELHLAALPKSLTALDIRGSSIKNLYNLQRMKYLEQLIVSYTNLETIANSLTPSNFPKLSLLQLDGLHFPDSEWSCVFKLSTLTSASLCKSNLTTVTGISTLAKTLKHLNISWTKISDITPLASLACLTSLNLSLLPIDSIASLRSLTNLVSLDLSFTQIQTAVPASFLINLEKLNLSGTLCPDVSCLAQLAKLRHLYLYDMPVVDVAPLRPLVRLRSLGLSGTAVCNLTPLVIMSSGGNDKDSGGANSTAAIMPELRDIGVSHTKVTDVSCLLRLKKLVNVFAVGLRLPDLPTNNNNRNENNIRDKEASQQNYDNIHIQNHRIVVWQNQFRREIDCRTDDPDMAGFELRRNQHAM